MSRGTRGRWSAFGVVLASVFAVVVPSGYAQDQPVPTQPPETQPPATQPTATVPTEPVPTDTVPSTSIPTDTTVPEGGNPPPSAPTTTGPDPSAANLELMMGIRTAYDEALAAEATVLEEHRLSLVRQSEIESEIAATELELVAAEAALADAIVASRQAETDHHVAQLTLARRRGELVDEVARLRRIAVDAYVGGAGGDPVSEAILGQDDISTVDVINQYAAVALGDQQSTINRIEELEIEIEHQREVATQSLRESVAHRGEVVALRDDLTELRAEQEQQAYLLSLEIEIQERLLADLRSRIDLYTQRLNALEADSDGVSAVLQSWQRGEARGARPTFSHPLPGQPVGRDFGPRVHPIFGGVRMHNGVDIGAPQGMPIRAAADGTVVMAELRQGFGNVVVIDHGGQYATVYAHQSQMDVRIGDLVRRGEIIGRVGSTGYSTGPHLHFEVRVLGEPVEPTGLMDVLALPPCDVLLASTDPVDIELLETRPECTEEPTAPLPFAQPAG